MLNHPMPINNWVREFSDDNDPDLLLAREIEWSLQLGEEYKNEEQEPELIGEMGDYANTDGLSYEQLNVICD